jgi:cobalt-zinc-cadmium efflux system outer membrane protein
MLERLRSEVRDRHPAVAAAAARTRAADAAVGEIRLWDDPTVGVAAMAAEREMRRDDGDLMLSAEQMLPRRGLYEARRQKALATKAVREAEAVASALELEAAAATTAIELALADEVLALESQQVAWIETTAAAARARLADPNASAAEPLKLEAELAATGQSLSAMRRRREALARRLNSVLGRPIDHAWPALALPSAPAGAPSLAASLELLRRHNPRLLALDRMAAAARADVAVAEKDRTPALSIGTEGAFYSGGDFRQATIGLKITLPWLNDPAYRAAIARAGHERDAATKDREAEEQRLRADIIAAVSEADTAAAQAVSQTAEVIPRARKAAETIENAWTTSNATLLEVLEARRSWLAARIEQRRLVAAHHAAVETLRSLAPPASTLR